MAWESASVAPLSNFSGNVILEDTTLTFRALEAIDPLKPSTFYRVVARLEGP